MDPVLNETVIVRVAQMISFGVRTSDIAYMLVQDGYSQETAWYTFCAAKTYLWGRDRNYSTTN